MTRADASTVGYTYDDIGQLTDANSSVNLEDRAYAYDAAWNMTSRADNGGSPSAMTVNGLNEVITNFDGGITYDDNGNMITYADGFATLDFDTENQLATLSTYHDLQVAYYYDGLKRLRGREEYTWNGSGWTLGNVTIYIYDGMRVIQEREFFGNTPLASYTRGTDLSGSLEGAGGIGGMLARSHGYASTNGHSYVHNYYFADGNGNITYLTDGTQSMTASYRYDPYGNLLSNSGSMAFVNSYRFSSKWADDWTGFYYYGYRWYVPFLQRWLNRDPLGDSTIELTVDITSQVFGALQPQLNIDLRDSRVESLNLYLPFLNNPLNQWDQFGLRADGEKSFWDKLLEKLERLYNWVLEHFRLSENNKTQYRPEDYDPFRPEQVPGPSPSRRSR